MMRPQSHERSRHILTVELEDYFQVGSLSGVVPQSHWHRFESRVEQNTLATLELLNSVGASATFFHRRLDGGSHAGAGARG